MNDVTELICSSGKLLKEDVIPAVMLSKMPIIMSKVLLQLQGEGGGGGEANAKHDTLFKGKTTTENSINGNT